MEPLPAPSRRTPLVVATAGLFVLACGAFWWQGQQAPAPGPQASVGESQSTGLTLHFADASGRALVPQAQVIAWSGPRSGLAEVQALLAALQQPPAGLQAAVPAGVKALSASYQAPNWDLVLQAPPGLGGTGEQLLLGAVVRSLLGATPGAEGVKLALMGEDGKPYSGAQWDLTAPLRAADFATQSGAAPVAGLEATLWWPTQGAEGHLVPTKTSLTAGEGAPAQDAFRAWLAGPPGSAKAFLAPAVPAGSEWRWEAMGPEGVAEVSVTGEKAPPAPVLEQAVRALVLTLTEWPTVKAVRVRHPDAPWPAALGPLAWAQPLTRAMAAQGVEGAK